MADEPFRVEIQHGAMGGRRTLRWAIYRGAELVTSSVKVYATERQARGDAEDQLKRILRRPPVPDGY
jgi:hypothetical protein